MVPFQLKAMHKPRDGEDELVESLLDEALAPYVGVVAPDVLRLIREEMQDRLLFAAAGRQLIRQVAPDPQVSYSGPQGGLDADLEESNPKKRSGGG